MAKYLFSYHGGKMPEGEEAMALGLPIAAQGHDRQSQIGGQRYEGE